MVVLSFVFLRKNMPNLERPYRVPAAKFIGTLAVLISIFFICLYLPFGPSPLIEIEWAMVLGWIVLGFILAFYAYFKYKDEMCIRDRACHAGGRRFEPVPDRQISLGGNSHQGDIAKW